MHLINVSIYPYAFVRERNVFKKLNLSIYVFEYLSKYEGFNIKCNIYT